MADNTIPPTMGGAKTSAACFERIQDLNQDFAAIISEADFDVFMTERWPNMRTAIPVALAFARYDRSALSERAREMASIDDGDKSLLITSMQLTADVVDFCKAQMEILESVQARLLICADDLLLEAGEESAFAETRES